MKHKTKIAVLIVTATMIAADFITRVSLETGEPPDISGVYLFKKENCSKDGCFYGALPEFSIGYLPDNEQVHISKTVDGFTIKHVGWGNKMMSMELLRKDWGMGWNNKEIVYKWTNWGAQLGIGRESRVLRLFFDDSRSLIVESTYRETGLAFFLVPFTESYTHIMKLVRVNAS